MTAILALRLEQVQAGSGGVGPVGGVSSFGYSGTIAHALLQGAPGGNVASALGGGAPLRFRRRAFSWASQEQRTRTSREEAPIIPFLGLICERSATSLVWEQQLSPFELAFLQGHRVGKVMLLPGTCYIEMARAAVRQQHGSASFALANVRFQTIMFLDEASWRGAPIVRLRLDTDAAAHITITARLEDGAWDTHAHMCLELRPGGAAAERLDPAKVQARCPEHVTGDAFYGSTGNDYRGEFRALAEGWGGGGAGETLGRVEYAHTETAHVHLRSCAWLDACTHPAIWWMEHKGRPFYAAAVRSYHILAMEVSANRELWSHLTVPDPAGGTGDLAYFDASLAPLVRIEGSTSGYFEVGWLESRRAVRQMYQTRWEEATPTGSDSGSSVLLLGAQPAAPAATPVLLSSAAPKLVGGTEGVLVLLAASSCGLKPLPMLHAALCVMTRMVTAPAARLVLLSITNDAHASCPATHAGLLGFARCVRQEAQLSQLSILHAAHPSVALREIIAWAGIADPEVAVALLRARVPRLAPLPFARHGHLQLRLPSRGAISNLKLEAQPDFDAPLGDSEIELEVRTRVCCATHTL